MSNKYAMLISGQIVYVPKRVFRIIAIHSEVYEFSEITLGKYFVWVKQSQARPKQNCPIDFVEQIQFQVINNGLYYVGDGHCALVADMTKPIDFWKNRRD